MARVESRVNESVRTMSIRKREGNRPDRRFVDDCFTSDADREALCARLRYVGSSNHKLRPADYGFHPSHNPRPSKSPCDAVRAVLLAEASELMRRGIKLGMVSRFDEGGVPKYIWAVDDANDVYEAKTKPELETDYHGYRLGEDEREMRAYILKEWKRRCQ